MSEIPFEEKDSWGRNGLMVAYYYGSKQVIEYISQFTWPECVDKEGRSADFYIQNPGGYLRRQESCAFFNSVVLKSNLDDEQVVLKKDREIL